MAQKLARLSAALENGVNRAGHRADIYIFRVRIFEIDHSNVFFAVFFSTIFLCGAWFPVELLPKSLQILAYILPTTSVIDLTRAGLNGNFGFRHVYETIYLILISFLLLEWALRSVRRRMVV